MKRRCIMITTALLVLGAAGFAGPSQAAGTAAGSAARSLAEDDRPRAVEPVHYRRRYYSYHRPRVSLYFGFGAPLYYRPHYYRPHYRSYSYYPYYHRPYRFYW